MISEIFRPSEYFIVGRVGIEQRPQVVEQRRRRGDWEGDTMAGKSGRLVTVVECKSR